jgi:hypothetical protein
MAEVMEATPATSTTTFSNLAIIANPLAGKKLTSKLLKLTKKGEDE